MEPKFTTPLQFSFTSINHALIIEKAGHYVEIVRRPGSRRVCFYADDLPEIHKLLDSFDRGESLNFPTKDLLESRTDLMQRAKRVAMEGV